MEPACTSSINYAKAQCMDASKEISQCYIAQCAINNKLHVPYLFASQYDLLLFYNRSSSLLH